jgi:hypothetical protein
MITLSKRVKIGGLIGYGLWGGLGAYRGIQDYKKKYDKDYKHYLEHEKYSRKPQYYYLSCLGVSLAHICLYLFPMFLGVTITTELYNLERAIRGIEEDE